MKNQIVFPLSLSLSSLSLSFPIILLHKQHPIFSSGLVAFPTNNPHPQLLYRRTTTKQQKGMNKNRQGEAPEGAKKEFNSDKSIPNKKNRRTGRSVSSSHIGTTHSQSTHRALLIQNQADPQLHQTIATSLLTPKFQLCSAETSKNTNLLNHRLVAHRNGRVTIDCILFGRPTIKIYLEAKDHSIDQFTLSIDRLVSWTNFAVLAGRSYFK